jgi:hypothetical protein
MHKLILVIGLVVLAVFGYWAATGKTAVPNGGQKACTAEAKICPDGSAVGRSGPNCEFAACPTVATATATTTLMSGQSSQINGITLTVGDLVEDSRCPTDVQCIQAGTVRVNVTIDAYEGNLSLTLGEPQVVKNLIVVLDSVTPAKHSKQSIKPSDYRFTFSVVPLESSDPGAGIP